MKRRKSDEDEDEHSIHSISMVSFPPMINRNPSHREIYERDCYKTFFNQICDRINLQKHFLMSVTGDPGIGKSYFYLYCTFKFTKDLNLLKGLTLIINSQSSYKKYDVDQKGFVDVSYYDIYEETSILRLIDGNTFNFYPFAGSSILFSSPSDKSLGTQTTFMKNYESYYLHMPAWSMEELLTVNKLLESSSQQQSEEEIAEKVSIAGPIPRSVLIKDTRVEQLKQNIEKYVNSSDAIDILTFCKEQNAVRDDHFSHVLLMTTPRSSEMGGASAFTVSFKSSYISDMILNKCKEDVKKAFKTFALEHSDTDSAKFRGNIYEFFVHDLMVVPTTHKMKSLSKNYEDTTFTVPTNTQKTIYNNLEEVSLSTAAAYYVPRARNQGA